MGGTGAEVGTCTATVRAGAGGGVSEGEGAGAASVGVGAIVIAPPCNHSPPRIAAHSLVPAQEWYRARTNQVAPTNPSIVPATFLRHSAALLRGDSTELLAKTGCLVSSATAQKFAEKTAEKVAAHTLLNAHGFSNLQTSLQRTAKAAGTVLLDNVEVLMPEGKHGTPTPLPAPRFGNSAAGGSELTIQHASAVAAAAAASEVVAAAVAAQPQMPEEERRLLEQRQRKKFNKQASRKRQRETAEGLKAARDMDASDKRRSRLKIDTAPANP
jgi:hypothetical protein